MYAHHPAQRLGRGRDRGGGFDRRALQAGERPRIAECPLSLECRCLWERELEPGDRNVVLCLKVVNVAMDPALYEGGRYGPKGYYVGTAGAVSSEIIQIYIQNQKLV